MNLNTDLRHKTFGLLCIYYSHVHDKICQLHNIACVENYQKIKHQFESYEDKKQHKLI